MPEKLLGQVPLFAIEHIGFRERQVCGEYPHDLNLKAFVIRKGLVLFHDFFAKVFGHVVEVNGQAVAIKGIAALFVNDFPLVIDDVIVF